MKSTNAAPSTKATPREAADLAVRYGEIGISAVVAELRYQSDVKNPAYAPAVHQLDRRSVDQLSEIAA